MNAFAGKYSIEYFYSKRSMIISLIIHVCFALIQIEKKTEEKKEENVPLKVTLVNHTKRPPAIRQLSKMKNVPKSPLKVQEEIKRPIPKNIAVGTQKVVPKSENLGNPKQKVVQAVQKGDPMSTKKVAYKPGTELLKTKSANIGSGLTSAKSVKTQGGGSGTGTGTGVARKEDTYQGLSSIKDMGLFNIKGSKQLKVAGIGGSGGLGHGKGNGVGDGFGEGGQGGPTGSTQGTLQVARVAANVGSFTGSTTGKIDSSKGAEGLSRKGDILLAGDPSETVIVGSIDPDVIRGILRDHRPQFAYCYQKVLDRNSNNENIQGVLKLNFVINKTGNVKSASVSSQKELPSSVKNCVTDVLMGIQFPAPKGGGVVEVGQPIYFYPKKL